MVIPLVNSDKLAMVDEDDYYKLLGYKWHLDGMGYARIDKRFGGITKTLFMHHVIMGNKLKYDHIDRNKLNNQKSNLRLCTQSQNCANRPILKKESTKFKGIQWMKSINKWRAKITFNSRQIHIGVFSNEVDAAKAYDKKALECFGEFAVLNF